MPDFAEILRLVLELDDWDDLRKAFDALDEGIFDHLAKALSERQKLRGRQVLIPEEITLCSSQTWRISPMALSSVSDARSMSRISAPIEPDRRRTLNLFPAITIGLAAAMSRYWNFSIAGPIPGSFRLLKRLASQSGGRKGGRRGIDRSSMSGEGGSFQPIATKLLRYGN